MAIEKTITVDGQAVKVKASAAVPRLYRNKFGRDLFRDLAKLTSEADGGGTLGIESLEVFENIAYIFAYHADPQSVPDSPDEWLEQFETFSVYQALPQIIELWGLNSETTVESKKN